MTPAEKQRRYRQRQAEKEAAHPAPLVPSAPPAASTPPLPRRGRPPTPPAAKPLGSTVEECEELASRLKAQSLAADADISCPWPVRASLKQSLVRVLAQLARHRGEGEVTESTVARSAPFRRVRDTMIGALKPYPEALRAVRDALVALENGGT